MIPFQSSFLSFYFYLFNTVSDTGHKSGIN
jgi:hypothetical protein